MDSLSQIVLGASVAEAFVGRKVGNKAIVWGAIAGTIPDLDVLLRPFLSPVEELIYHRSFSHSIILFIFLAPALGWLIKKIHEKDNATFWDWTVASFFCFFTHSILDCFTTWGTQLFWPLPHRIAFQSIFVIDPLYTLPFLGFLIAAMCYRKDQKLRKKLNLIALILSSSYLIFTLVNKFLIYQDYKQDLVENHRDYLNLSVRPAPLQNFLWTANIELENHFLISYQSLLRDEKFVYDTIPKNHHLLQSYTHHKDVQTLIFMCNGLYTVQKKGNDLIFNDLRFGQVLGWREKKGPFAFSYLLKKKQNNKIEVSKIEIDRNNFQYGDVLLSIWDRI